MEERRGRKSGQVSHVACRDCHAPVRLDPAVMTVTAGGARLRCPACAAAVWVRRWDAQRGMWADQPPPDATAPAKPSLKLGLLRRRRRTPACR